MHAEAAIVALPSSPCLTQAGGGSVDAGWLNCEDSVDWEAVSVSSFS